MQVPTLAVKTFVCVMGIAQVNPNRSPSSSDSFSASASAFAASFDSATWSWYCVSATRDHSADQHIIFLQKRLCLLGVEYSFGRS